MSTVVERDPQLEPSPGPVGLHATEVHISERPAWKADGFIGIALVLVLAGVGVWGFIRAEETQVAAWGVVGGVAYLFLVVIAASLTIVQPGQTQVVQFFGRYVGTVRKAGLLLSLIHI